VIIDYVEAYKISMMAEEHVRPGRVQQQVNVAWLPPPPPGWIVLNSDGAAKSNDNKAGCGGVLRNEQDMWLDGFAKALVDTTAYMAKLWGIYEELKLAKQREMVKLEVRTDSQVIAQSLHERKNGSTMGCALMKQIRRLLEGPWEVHIVHVFREANRCADIIANMGCEGMH
jgi:ribonuclease HI